MALASPEHCQRKPNSITRQGVSIRQHAPEVDRKYVPDRELERMGVNARHGRRRDEAMVDPMDASIEACRAMERVVYGVEGDLGDDDVERQLEEQLSPPHPLVGLG